LKSSPKGLLKLNSKIAEPPKIQTKFWRMKYFVSQTFFQNVRRSTGFEVKRAENWTFCKFGFSSAHLDVWVRMKKNSRFVIETNVTSSRYGRDPEIVTQWKFRVKNHTVVKPFLTFHELTNTSVLDNWKDEGNKSPLSSANMNQRWVEEVSWRALRRLLQCSALTRRVTFCMDSCSTHGHTPTPLTGRGDSKVQVVVPSPKTSCENRCVLVFADASRRFCSS
jgi:hypothetical protein